MATILTPSEYMALREAARSVKNEISDGNAAKDIAGKVEYASASYILELQSKLRNYLHIRPGGAEESEHVREGISRPLIPTKIPEDEYQAILKDRLAELEWIRHGE